MSDRTLQTYAVPDGQPISAPYLYASSFSVQATANDVTIVLHDTIPLAGRGGVSSDAELRRPIAIVKLSPQSAKDFSAIIGAAMRQYEEIYKVTLVTDGSGPAK